MKSEMYEKITNSILECMEKGKIPWQKPFGGGGGTLPQNMDGRAYRGVNVAILWAAMMKKGYTDLRWVTFKRAKDLGGSVRKGEKSTQVVLYRFFDVKDKETEEVSRAMCARFYNVFNVEQIEWEKPLDAPKEGKCVEPIEECERIVEEMPSRPWITHHSAGGCFYRPSSDSVHMMERSFFKNSEGYYATLFHELAHATGAKCRIGREGITETSRFGDDVYSEEELVAELASAFVCGSVGILPAQPKNHAAYLQGWMKALKESKQIFVRAAAQAQRAADWILNERQDRDKKEDESC